MEAPFDELLEFPNIKTLELTNWSRSYFSSDMVLISLFIKHRNKGGALICKYPYSRAALIRVAALNRSFMVISSSTFALFCL